MSKNAKAKSKQSVFLTMTVRMIGPATSTGFFMVMSPESGLISNISFSETNSEQLHSITDKQRRHA